MPILNPASNFVGDADDAAEWKLDADFDDLDFYENQIQVLVSNYAEVGKAFRTQLRDRVARTAIDVENQARARADRSHGQPVPTRLSAGIFSGVEDNGDDIEAYVRSEDPIESILEYGATIPPHTILPDAKDALHFGDGFFHTVRSPGGVIPPHYIIEGAFDEVVNGEAAEVDLDPYYPPRVTGWQLARLFLREGGAEAITGAGILYTIYSVVTSPGWGVAAAAAVG